MNGQKSYVPSRSRDRARIDTWLPRTDESPGDKQCSSEVDPWVNKYSEEGQRVRTCPRCGAKLFADMNTCYGCLYDFSRDQTHNHIDENQVAVDTPKSFCMPDIYPEISIESELLFDEPVVDVGLDEPWEFCRENKEANHASPENEMHGENDASEIRNHKLVLKDACDLTKQKVLSLSTKVCDQIKEITILIPGFELHCEITSDGLSVGCAQDNDIIVNSRTVSPHHMRFLLVDNALLAQDFDATNPALVNGVPLVDTISLFPHDIVELRGTGMTILV